MSLSPDSRQETRDTREARQQPVARAVQGGHTVQQYELNYMKINEQTTQYTCAAPLPPSRPAYEYLII